MAKHNAANERIKREYFAFLREAKGRDQATIDRAAMALARFEVSTGHKDFRKFHKEQAVAFKRRLSEQLNGRTGERLSKATIASILRDLKAFFEWLSREPGYRSKLQYSDADYFSQSEKDATIARSQREKNVPSVEQVEHVLKMMPGEIVLDRRDRALVAFTALTAARVNALASFQIGHVNLREGYVEQDARHVRTKFSKSFRTWFMPVVEGALEIVTEWVEELREQQLWAPADPLFPTTSMGIGENGAFEPIGLGRQGWKSTQPIREIFRRAFESAGLPYFNPHSFRDMLVRYAMSLNVTPEQMKAWSQNLGHEQVLTTLTNYGSIPVHRQGEIIRGLNLKEARDPLNDPDVRELINRIQQKRH